MALQAGAAQMNITPKLGTSLAGYFSDRKAQRVHDELWVKALVLDNGEMAIALVVADLICLEREFIDRAKSLIQQRCGLPPESVLVSCTHTHTGPATVSVLGVEQDREYVEWLVPRIADSVQMAWQNRQPAQLGIGVGREERVSFNRRYLMKDGTVRMNPGYLNPDIVQPVGPTDPDVMVLRVTDLEERNIAIYTVFALHYVGAPSHDISADYFGFFAEALQRFYGETFVAMLANGCCGDVNNIDVYHPPRRKKPYEQAKHVARVVAAEALKTGEFVEFTQEVSLAASLEELTLPLRKPTEEQVRRAHEILANPQNYSATEVVYAREHLKLLEFPAQVTTPIQVLRVHDAAVVGLPGEIFAQTGLDIKAASPFPVTFVVELANDWVGYVPTGRAFEEGGYETWLARSSKVAPGAAEAMVEVALKQLRRLHLGQ